MTKELLTVDQFVHSKLIGYERLPMLEVICASLIKLLSVSLRRISEDNVSAEVLKITSCRFGECIKNSSKLSVFSIFEVEEWNNYGLIIVEPKIIYSIVEILMGSTQKKQKNIKQQSLTRIDLGLVNRFLKIVLFDLSESFSLISKTTFRLIRTEVDSKFAFITRDNNASILIKISIKIGSNEGECSLVLPYATIEPIKELLSQQFIGEKFGRDKIWETHLAEELRKAEVNLLVALCEQPVDLRDLIFLKIGTVLNLDFKLGNYVEVKTNGVCIFQAFLAFKVKYVAAVIQDTISNIL